MYFDLVAYMVLEEGSLIVLKSIMFLWLWTFAKLASALIFMYKISFTAVLLTPFWRRKFLNVRRREQLESLHLEFMLQISVKLLEHASQIKFRGWFLSLYLCHCFSGLNSNDALVISSNSNETFRPNGINIWTGSTTWSSTVSGHQSSVIVQWMDFLERGIIIVCLLQL